MEKGKNVFIAPDARVIGQVSIGDRASIWFGAVVRGDVEKIKLNASHYVGLAAAYLEGKIYF